MLDKLDMSMFIMNFLCHPMSPDVTPTQTWPDVPQRSSAWRASQGVLQRIRHGLRQRLRLCRLRAADLGDDQLSSWKVVASPGFHPAKMVVKHQKQWVYHGFSSKKWGFNMGERWILPERGGQQSVELIRILHRWGEMWKPGGFDRRTH
jgi:hypothetical protein